VSQAFLLTVLAGSVDAGLSIMAENFLTQTGPVVNPLCACR